MKRHQQLLTAAIEREGAAHRALFDGNADAARAAFIEASACYRESWEEAPPRSYGRLVGMLKSAVLAGGGETEARYAAQALSGQGEASPTAAYARALAALISGDEQAAARESAAMRGDSEAFERAAEAIAALAASDAERFAAALEQIVSDFERRTDHLTGVPVADTALMLEALAARRGIAAELSSPVLPGT